MPSLRSPFEQLAGCLWLPRFLSKIRLHLAGRLPSDYQKPFCHPRGIDGHFLAHFGIQKEELIGLVEAGKNDQEISDWFEVRTSPEQRNAWNDIAVNIGKPGYPMYETVQWARKHFHSDCQDPALDTAFKMIEWDENRP